MIFTDIKVEKLLNNLAELARGKNMCTHIPHEDVANQIKMSDQMTKVLEAWLCVLQ